MRSPPLTLVNRLRRLRSEAQCRGRHKVRFIYIPRKTSPALKKSFYDSRVRGGSAPSKKTFSRDTCRRDQARLSTPQRKSGRDLAPWRTSAQVEVTEQSAKAHRTDSRLSAGEETDSAIEFPAFSRGRRKLPSARAMIHALEKIVARQ